MKQYIRILILLPFIFIIACEDFLEEGVGTNISSSYLYSTPDGLKAAVVGLYDQNRDIYNNIDAENTRSLYIYVLHDLVVAWESYLRIIARWAPDNAHNAYNYGSRHLGLNWQHHYTVIDRANSIIKGANEISGMDETERLRAIGEAMVFRSNSLLILWQMFNNVFIKTEPTTPENATIRVEKPKTKEEILAQLEKDLDIAIENLEWTYNDEPGRVTKALAYHLRAKVALWQEDWSKAAECADAIIDKPEYYELVELDEVFSGDRNHKESLFTVQLARGVAGGGPDNMIAATFNADYNGVTGAVFSVEQGGRGFGFVFPNNYLLNLYEQGDQRREIYYINYYYYNDPDNLPDSVLVAIEGETEIYDYPEIGDTIIELNTNKYYRRIHPTIKKYFDEEADPVSALSQKNLLIYRLAETYLIAAEAYMRMGDQTAACSRINTLRHRAGLTNDITELTEDELMDEHARELAFEGQRFFFLKRIGKLVTQVRQYVGDDGIRDLGRNNIQDYMIHLPIPNSELELLGPSYPQNPGYN